MCSRWVFLVIAVVPSCAAPGGRSAARPEDVPAAAVTRAAPTLPQRGPSWRDVLVLPAAADEEMASVGTQSIRKSQVFDRLLETDPALARALVDLCVLDAVVAEAAERFSIAVTDAEIAERVRVEEAALRSEASLEPADDAGLARVVAERFGLDLGAWREVLRRDVARVLLRSYAIRLLALREDRVEVRILVHTDRALLEKLAADVRGGADFVTLVRRHSIDPSAREGGALPPIGAGMDHPLAAAAFALEPGEVSPLVSLDGRERHAILWCVAKNQARAVDFPAAKEAILRGLRERPISPFEQNAFVLRYCRDENGSTSSDSLDSVGADR
ncbi:MAG: peptidylprolyl isomerase [Planctomycetota bacterium]